MEAKKLFDKRVFYKITEDGMMLAYLGKAVDRNARFLNTPYGRKKLLVINRIPVSEFHHVPEEEPECLPEDLQKKADFINSLLEPEQAKKIFGDRWKLFVGLIREYTETPGMTYQKLSDKYDIPLGSISYTFVQLKTKLIEQWEESLTEKDTKQK